MQGPKFLLCHECDRKQHPYAHFHRRHAFSQGYFEPLGPSSFLQAEPGSRATASKCSVPPSFSMAFQALMRKYVHVPIPYVYPR